MIEFRNVSKEYKGQEVLNDFNLTIHCQEFLTVIGSSGSGKTTILKMINGLLTPNKGEILINGVNVKDTDIIKLRRKIGYSIQGNVLFPHLNVYDNMAYVLQLQKRDKKEIDKLVKEKLELLGLPDDILYRFPNELSGGQQQRVGIARALIADPEILLMDEPFGAVDSITRNQLQEELKKLHRESKLTIVFITHDIVEALKLGTQVLVFDDGKIQQMGTPEEIINNPSNEFVKNIINIVKY